MDKLKLRRVDDDCIVYDEMGYEHLETEVRRFIRCCRCKRVPGLDDMIYFGDTNFVYCSNCTDLTVEATLTCAGCHDLFTVDPEDPRAIPDLDPELIYCNACNREAEQWCKEIEESIYP